MKKILTLVFGASLSLCATAQYISTQQGTSMEYKTVFYLEKDSTVVTATADIISVSEDGGKTTILTREVTPMPESAFGEKADTTTTIYNAADQSTQFIMSNPEDAKKNVIEMVKMQIQASGQAVSIADMEDFISSIRTKGELSITIKPDMAAGTKLPNKSLRITVGQETMSYNIWEAKVEGTETITTPAGSFECLKVTFVNRISAGQENQKINVSEWFAPGIGAVKVVQSIKGKPVLSQELTKVTKP